MILRLVSVGVVLLELSGRVTLPPAPLTHMTFGFTERAVTTAVLQISVKDWPASVLPIEVTVTSGAGSAGEKNKELISIT